MLSRRWWLVAMAAAVGTLPGCGGGEPAQPAPAPTPQAAAPAPEPTPEPAPAPEPAKPGLSLYGEAVLRGTVYGPPPAKPAFVTMSGDQYCEHAHTEPVPEPSQQISADGRVQWAFVYVKAGMEDRAYPTPEATVTLNQVGCMFDPHVFGIMTDQVFEIHNSDQTTHNVNAKPTNNKRFNVGHPPIPGLVHKKSFPNPDVMVRVKCDVHPWMSNYIGVLPHPFYAVTDAAGTFTIPKLPPGTYTIAAWHETLGTVEQEVEIPADGEVALDFRFGAS